MTSEVPALDRVGPRPQEHALRHSGFAAGPFGAAHLVGVVQHAFGTEQVVAELIDPLVELGDRPVWRSILPVPVYRRERRRQPGCW